MQHHSFFRNFTYPLYKLPLTICAPVRIRARVEKTLGDRLLCTELRSSLEKSLYHIVRADWTNKWRIFSLKFFLMHSFLKTKWHWCFPSLTSQYDKSNSEGYENSCSSWRPCSCPFFISSCCVQLYSCTCYLHMQLLQEQMFIIPIRTLEMS